MKNNVAMPKQVCVKKSSVLYSELAPLTHGITCSKLWRYEENIGDKKLPLEHPPW